MHAPLFHSLAVLIKLHENDRVLTWCVFNPLSQIFIIHFNLARPQLLITRGKRKGRGGMVKREKRLLPLLPSHHASARLALSAWY